MSVIYIRPYLSRLTTGSIEDNYDVLYSSLKKKYGKPTTESFGSNNINDSILKMMLNNDRKAIWKKNNLLIELHSDDTIEKAIDGLSELGLWKIPFG